MSCPQQQDLEREIASLKAQLITKNHIIDALASCLQNRSSHSKSYSTATTPLPLHPDTTPHSRSHSRSQKPSSRREVNRSQLTDEDEGEDEDMMTSSRDACGAGRRMKSDASCDSSGSGGSNASSENDADEESEGQAEQSVAITWAPASAAGREYVPVGSQAMSRNTS